MEIKSQIFWGQFLQTYSSGKDQRERERDVLYKSSNEMKSEKYKRGEDKKKTQTQEPV